MRVIIYIWNFNGAQNVGLQLCIIADKPDRQMHQILALTALGFASCTWGNNSMQKGVVHIHHNGTTHFTPDNITCQLLS